MLAPCWVLVLLVSVSSIAASPAYEVIKVMEEDIVASIMKKRMYEDAMGEYSYLNSFWIYGFDILHHYVAKMAFGKLLFEK